ncbi:GTPase activating protein (Evi5), putative [Metarhizium acridum CQMa 102]|uniref:GTPase activating protein (Evi5), putative n=1 Tax=Metarhizium acridum (strain CQMa 102) TaxID=655827 RepID=E9E982_METAQ|nr:GTPase activating protein (Evi5), putative [Metarhizium acridum CQMa 102]EFY87586.1 GTPase activating protein (Evi5), putative [Metarhizium acridum CQMa 102]
MVHSEPEEPTGSTAETQAMGAEEPKLGHPSSPSNVDERTSTTADLKGKADESDEIEWWRRIKTGTEEPKQTAKSDDADEAGETEETEAETPKMAHDSMVTVRLSEPPPLSLDTMAVTPNAEPITPTSPIAGETSTDANNDGLEKEKYTETRDSLMRIPRVSAPIQSPTDANRTLQDELGLYGVDGNETDSSEDNEEVNWEQLEKTEDEQMKDEETDNSTALLLARLEQENAKLATNPKSVKVQTVEKLSSTKPRPPSMAQLRKMVSGPTPAALRYSMLPPPPMTDLEFYAALVKDYQQTAARLPTLLSNKIRKGIPPPLRGVVWQSMSGARDSVLEEQYERFCGETSPYELLIGKDLGRSFPGVDMFRDPDGDGQRYCQGLAFLVGPLLMHMPDKQAFCVLVRLMEKYDLRECFLPDLSGLHVRIYQFRELLRLNLPALADHLDELQVETAYVSQWFLSFFAVTCPLPMLFRIYDVIFAEGASETLMRVALSLMRKNETRLLACTELEDVMQLLLSRGLWDCYHYNADEFVQDFASLGGVVTRERLSQLAQAYRESLVATANAARMSDITTAASRFLGRIWAASSKNGSLAPASTTGPARPLSMLRRSTSKQSIASTLNSMEASSVSVVSTASTDASTISRDSANGEDEPSSRESTPVGPKTLANTKTTEERYLHSQIEDLLTALSELQRNHALLSNQLQSEREEREEDRKTVRSLLDGLRRRVVDHDVAKGQEEIIPPSRTEEGEPPITGMEDDDATPTIEDPVLEPKSTAEDDYSEDAPSTGDLSELLDRVESRFAIDDGNGKHRSSMLQSKSQLREELLNTKGQLASAVSHSQELSRRIHEMDQELSALREQLRERHGHVRTLHQDKQRLEKQIHGMRARISSSSISEPNNRDADPDWVGKGKSGGLREFKLGRSKSTPQTPGYGKRISSLPQNPESVLAAGSGVATPPNEHEALLLELVQAKTAEATAKQEAEEAKQKLEALRKAHVVPSDSHGASPGSASLGVFSRLTGQATTPPAENTLKPTAATAGTSPNTGGFWGWRR